MTETPPLDVFRALADPLRVRLVSALGRGGPANATQLAESVPVSRQAVVKHLQVLRDAGLITAARRGQQVVFTVAPDRLAHSAAWLSDIATEWDQALATLKAAAEQG